MPNTYTLKHTDKFREQTIRFDGQLLGEASSYQPGKDRWSETRIYRTTANEYVIEKMGNSSRPDDQIRSTIHRAATARGAIECLQTQDEDGVIYFTRVARVALEQATLNDADLAQAYNVQDLT